MFPVGPISIPYPISAPSPPIKVENVRFEPFWFNIKIKQLPFLIFEVLINLVVVGKSDEYVIPVTYAFPSESISISHPQS